MNMKCGLYQCNSIVRYTDLHRVGEGTYGVVFRARDKVTGEIVALKSITKTSFREGFPVTSLREISLLRRLKHPNILNIRDVVVGSEVDEVYLVFQFCEYDLSKLVFYTNIIISIEHIKFILLELLKGLQFIHEQFIIHRDLKPSNILITCEGIPQIADFGLARVYGHPLEEYSPKVSTLWYRAPELLLGTGLYHTSIDIWSLGCMFGEMVLEEPLFPGKNDIHQLDCICDIMGSPNELLWNDFNLIDSITILPKNRKERLHSMFSSELSSNGIDLLKKMLCLDPSRRISASKALEHSFFKEGPGPIPLSLASNTCNVQTNSFQ